MNGLVPGAFTLKHTIILLGSTFDERRNGRVQLPLVKLMRGGLDNGDQTVESIENDIVRSGIVYFRSRRALTF